MALAGKKRKIFDGRYEILSIVGRGACSVVYHARHAVAPASEVALKVLLNDKDQRASGEKLRKEALAMVSSRHKYVVRLDDFHSVGELCYLSMEFAPESDLRRYAAKTGGKLNPVQAELFLLQLCEALAFIHRAGIVHRDIKSDNILVVNPKEIRLADFGVALLPGDKSSLAELQKGVGTMDYMAPEVLEGKNYDLQSDIYALGVTFYELLSGKHPFANAPLVEQLNVRRDGSFPHLREAAPHIAPYLANVIMQAMSYEANARFPSTKELAQALLVNRPKPNDLRTKPAVSATPGSTAPTAVRASVPNASQPQTQTGTTAQPATPPPQAPSNAILSAIRAAAETKTSKPPAASSSAQSTATAQAAERASPTPAPQAAPTPEGAGKQPPTLGGDSPEARREAARALLRKQGPGPAPSGPAQATAAPASTPASRAPEPKAAPAAATSQPAPARPTAGVRDTPPTQTLSAQVVKEVTAPAKSESFISRAFDSSDAVAQPMRTAPERGAGNAAPAAQPSLIAAAREAFNKSEKPAAAPVVDNKKATQLITRDLVDQVRTGMKDDKKKRPELTKPLPAEELPGSVEETVVIDPAKVKAPKKKRFRPRLDTGMWRKDPRKSKYMALSMGILMAILWFGNIFLIRNYNIGVGKSFLGLDSSYPSPIPEFAGGSLAFPAVPSGLYGGFVQNLVGGRSAPLTLISFGEQKKLAVIVGIDGWTPAVVSVDSAAKAEQSDQPLRIVSNGIVLNMSGTAADGELRGSFEDVITGEISQWRAKPIVRE